MVSFATGLVNYHTVLTEKPQEDIFMSESKNKRTNKLQIIY